MSFMTKFVFGIDILIFVFSLASNDLETIGFALLLILGIDICYFIIRGILHLLYIYEQEHYFGGYDEDYDDFGW